MGLPFADTQCGIKAFTRAAAQTVFQLQTIERWGFDPEILFIATQARISGGRGAGELGSRRAHPDELSADGLQMLKELAIVRWNALTRPVQQTD